MGGDRLFEGAITDVSLNVKFTPIMGCPVSTIGDYRATMGTEDQQLTYNYDQLLMDLEWEEGDYQGDLARPPMFVATDCRCYICGHRSVVMWLGSKFGMSNINLCEEHATGFRIGTNPVNSLIGSWSLEEGKMYTGQTCEEAGCKEQAVVSIRAEEFSEAEYMAHPWHTLCEVHANHKRPVGEGRFFEYMGVWNIAECEGCGCIAEVTDNRQHSVCVVGEDGKNTWYHPDCYYEVFQEWAD